MAAPTLVQGIPADSIIFDSEDHIIIVDSNIGGTTYFEVDYDIDSAALVSQVWSRINDVRMQANTRRSFTELFELRFRESVTSAITYLTDAIITASITITERDRVTDAIEETITSDSFYVHASLKRLTSDIKTQLLQATSLPATVPDGSLLDPSGMLILPFFVSSITGEDATFTITLKDDALTTLREDTYTTEKLGSHEIAIHLSELDLSLTTGLTLQITGPNNVALIKTYKLITVSHYPIKRLVFMDVLGRYQYAYFIGKMTTQLGYDRDTYALQDDTYKTTTIDEDETITINCGYLNRTQYGIVRQLLNSPEIYLYRDGEYISISPETTKATYNEDNTALYEEDLKFKINSTQD